MLNGLMQEQPLLISSLIEHAARLHPQGEIVSRTSEGPMHRCTYADVRRRACQLANALTALGVSAGERVATLAWNGYRHMDLYHGVSVIGGGPAHDESAPLSRADRVHRQPCRGPAAVLRSRVATWWLPDDVAFVDELPHTATGKLHKLRLREQFQDYRLPGA
jgi:acyl-CoA synthetase (AMP-forming)/AMP-acid ligase II